MPPVAPLPFVSVVLPVRDEARTIRDTIGLLVEGDYPADRLEILVVDGGSRDATRELVAEVAAEAGRADREPHPVSVRCLENPAGITPAGLNVGIAAAKGDVLVRMDGHAQPAPDYVRACVAALARTGAWAVGGLMVGRGETAFGRAVALATATPLGAGDARFRLGGSGPVDTVYLGAWPKWVFERVGGFDEGLVRNQDYELCWRIRQAGGLVWLDPAIRSTTVTRGSWVDLARQYFGYGQGRVATTLLHPRSLRLRQLLPAAFVAGAVAMVLGGKLGWIAWRSVAFWGVIYAAAVAGSTLAARRQSRGREWMWLPVVYPILHLSWGAGFWVGLVRSPSGRHNSHMPESPRP